MKKIIIARKLSKAQFMSQVKTCIKAPFSMRLLTLCQLQQLAHVTNHIGIFKRGVSI